MGGSSWNLFWFPLCNAEALAALARKKRYEQQLTQIDGTLTTIEYQREALESASTNAEVLKTMQFGAQALKQAHNNLDVDKVHDVMDDITEQQQIAAEISQAISQPSGLSSQVDEDELLKELEDLEQENLNEQLLNTESVGTLPSVPDSLPAQPAQAQPAAAQKKKVAVDADLAELESWAANWTPASLVTQSLTAHGMHSHKWLLVHQFTYSLFCSACVTWELQSSVSDFLKLFHSAPPIIRPLKLLSSLLVDIVESLVSIQFYDL